ncbi:MAG: hypothetical protein IPM77_08485 [Crocinitomicaceae bacterium]|nr:hypothetical protein [Crocinitomicaceae bacterium]
MPGLRRVFTILIIFLGPGFAIWWIAHTVKNHFIVLPYLGYEYKYDSSGNVIDSVAYQIPEFSLISFDGETINRDSIRDKFIILTTIQNTCPDIKECGPGFVLFNEILYSKMIEHSDSYKNVRVISLLTDENGNPDSIPSQLLLEEMEVYDHSLWWFASGDVKPFYSFNYYGERFIDQPSTPSAGEIGNKAFVNSLVLIDKDGHIRGVTGAKSDTDIRNFFDLLKLLKKEEFEAARANKNK